MGALDGNIVGNDLPSQGGFTGTLNTNSPDLDPSSPMNSQPNNAPAPQKQPSMWKQVLAGALQGMADGFGANTVAGGAQLAQHAARQRQEFALEQQKAASDVRFRDAQAAASVAEATERNARVKALPQAQLDAHNKAVADTVETYTKMFGPPTAIVDTTDNGELAMQHLRDLTSLQGAVDRVMTVPAGDKTYVWNTGDVAASGGAVPMVKAAGKALGIGPMASMTADGFKGLTKTVKDDYLAKANDLFSPIVPDKKDPWGQLKRLQSAQRMLNAGVTEHPDFQPLLDRVNSNIEAVQDRIKENDRETKEKANLQMRNSVATRVAGQNARAIPVVDSDGNVVVKHAGDAVASGDAPAAQGVKAMSQTTQLQEMQVASRNLRKVVEKLEPFTATQTMQIKAALGEASEGFVADTLKAKLANQQLTPAQQDFVVWAGQMQERAMALRSASGIGQQGSDKLRAAIVATLPNEKDTKELRLKKLNAFDNQVSILMRGVPGVGRGGKNKTVDVSAPASNAKPKSDPLGIF